MQWNVSKNIDKTLEVRGDQGIEGMLSVSDNVFTDFFLQSDKLGREEKAPNLPLINPDAKIVEVPLSPGLANWMFQVHSTGYIGKIGRAEL